MNTQADAIEIEVKDAGEISAGFLFASFKNIGDTDITVGGVSLPPGEAKGYPFVGKSYSSIPYDATGGILRILQII